MRGRVRRWWWHSQYVGVIRGDFSYQITNVFGQLVLVIAGDLGNALNLGSFFSNSARPLPATSTVMSPPIALAAATTLRVTLLTRRYRVRRKLALIRSPSFVLQFLDQLVYGANDDASLTSAGASTLTVVARGVRSTPRSAAVWCQRLLLGFHDVRRDA